MSDLEYGPAVASAGVHHAAKDDSLFPGHPDADDTPMLRLHGGLRDLHSAIIPLCWQLARPGLAAPTAGHGGSAG
jgi:hypothetical protein